MYCEMTKGVYKIAIEKNEQLAVNALRSLYPDLETKPYANLSEVLELIGFSTIDVVDDNTPFVYAVAYHGIENEIQLINIVHTLLPFMENCEVHWTNDAKDVWTMTISEHTIVYKRTNNKLIKQLNNQTDKQAKLAN